MLRYYLAMYKMPFQYFTVSVSQLLEETYEVQSMGQCRLNCYHHNLTFPPSSCWLIPFFNAQRACRWSISAE